jgi:hypothetical protein
MENISTDFSTWQHQNLVNFAIAALAKIEQLEEERDTYRDAWRQALVELDRAER